VNALPFGPYDAIRDVPVRGSVPVTALVLTKDEEANIARCLASLAWCDQALVIDSGSSDGTVRLAEAMGAEVIKQPWLGFAGQREFALRHGAVRNDWVYFVDADEWVSGALAREIGQAIVADGLHAYRQRFRLIFLGRWIAHCGWYDASHIVRLGRRGSMSFRSASQFGERAQVVGSIGTLSHDLVDEDRKGLAAWLRKHIVYAEAEAQRRREQPRQFRRRLQLWLTGKHNGRAALRSLAKDVAFPALPVRPLLLVCYMYIMRGGWRDGRQGLIFCLYHAWFELTVSQLTRARSSVTP